jgi:hypothetical protein
MNLRFSSPSGGFAFIQIITEDGYIVYRYTSEDDHNRSMPWLETYEIDGTRRRRRRCCRTASGFRC